MFRDTKRMTRADVWSRNVFNVSSDLQSIACLYRRSLQIRYAANLKHGTGHAFKCLGWPCPATFIFLLFGTPIVTLFPCAPKHLLQQRMFWGVSEFQST